MKLKFIIDKKYDRRFVSKDKIAEFNRHYKLNSKYLEYSRKEYQESWNEIGREFSDYIKKETGYDWFYNTYYCVMSVMHPGISNWGDEPMIVRTWQENAYTQRRITAHELIISHYFEIFKRHYSDRKLRREEIWVLAEIAAFALTSLPKKAQEFWSWDNSGYYTDHNYPEIVPLQNKLKEKFLKRRNFDEYIEAGIKIIESGRMCDKIFSNKKPLG